MPLRGSAPAPTGSIDLFQGGHGGIALSPEGRYAGSHTPDVFDARTKQRVATLRDEKGKPYCSSKLVEIQFWNGEVTAVGDRLD